MALTSEWKNYRWGPAAPRDQVPSLLAPDGYFYPDTGPAASHAKPEDAEREIRAQLEWAERLGIHPTHLDIHMGTLAARPELYQALIRVAHVVDAHPRHVRADGAISGSFGHAVHAKGLCEPAWDCRPAPCYDGLLKRR